MAAGLTYLFDDLPEPGNTIEVRPGIHWVRMPLPFALNHINLWLLRDGEGWTIVDCGYGTEPTHALWQQVFDRITEGRPIHRVIVTHYHPDHVGSARWLAEKLGAEVWMTESEFLAAHGAREGRSGFNNDLALRYFIQHGLDPDRAKAQETRGNSYGQGVPSMVDQYRRMIEGDDIEIDGKQWRVIIGRGHAPEHAMLYCGELGILISGDQVLPRITTNIGVWPSQPNGDPLKLFLSTMKALEPLPADTLILPSHDRVFTGLHARFEQLREHHSARLDEMKGACAQPRTAAEIVPVLFRRALDDHQLIFAMGEAIAHLNYLMYQGGVTRTQDEAGRYRFASAGQA
jgi:glyoxylase-like metal-dependent hydrolase (beta-lactamase superfamily II)